MAMFEQTKMRRRLIILSFALFFMFALILLVVITGSISSQEPVGETEWMRASWPLALYFLGLSFSIKTSVLYFMGWGEIEQCLSSASVMYSASLLILVLLLLLILITNTPHDFDIRESLSGFLWWQNLYIYFFPIPTLIEGRVLSRLNLLNKGYSKKKPRAFAFRANLIDAIIRFGYFAGL